MIKREGKTWNWYRFHKNAELGFPDRLYVCIHKELNHNNWAKVRKEKFNKDKGKINLKRRMVRRTAKRKFL